MGRRTVGLELQGPNILKAISLFSIVLGLYLVWGLSVIAWVVRDIMEHSDVVMDLESQGLPSDRNTAASGS